jgi:RNA polymerase-interacting CarD/CdnL/TRCF family regulator
MSKAGEFSFKMRERAKYRTGMILIHPAHGALRIEKILSKSELDKNGLCLHLKPVSHNYVGTSFYVPAARIQEEGLHPPLSVTDVRKILRHLKNGRRHKGIPQEECDIKLTALSRENNPTAFADILSLLSRTRERRENWGKKALFQHSAAALIHEFAFALKIPVAKASRMICKTLTRSERVHRWFQGVLERVD